MIYMFILILLTTLLLTVIALKKLIPYLKHKKIGQKILDIGPNWHKTKEGTPTMGGVAFIFASLVSAILFVIVFYDRLDNADFLWIINVFGFGVLNALIGLIDDLAKMKKSKNEGLTPKMKFLFQSIVAILFLISLSVTLGIDTDLLLPFFNRRIEIGIIFYPVSFLLLCGIVNSVNLTDGIDGLAGSVTLTVGIFTSFLALRVENEILILIGATLVGSMLGFLAFNMYPAKVFMGDTGSLFLGAIIVSIAFVIDNPLLVLIYGFVYVIEAVSDIMQVAYYKLSHGKRIFKMAPLHHHFEKNGYSEMKIVAVFSIVNFAFCILALLGIGNL